MHVMSLSFLSLSRARARARVTYSLSVECRMLCCAVCVHADGDAPLYMYVCIYMCVYRLMSCVPSGDLSRLCHQPRTLRPDRVARPQHAPRA